MELTLSQQVAIDAFKKFLKCDNQVFVLKGAAGTGKTTLISEFLRILHEDNRECDLMAPTGRAAYIIGSKTKHAASTIHRGIYRLSNLKSISQNKEEEDDGGLHLKYCLNPNRSSLRKV